MKITIEQKFPKPPLSRGLNGIFFKDRSSPVPTNTTCIPLLVGEARRGMRGNS